MAAGPFTVYSNAALGISQAAMNLASDTFVMVLLTSAYTPAPDTDTHWSDISANEVATGLGYTAGGKVITETDVLSGHTATFTFSPVTFAAFSGTFKYVALVRRAGASLAGTDLLLCVSDFNPGAGSITGTGSDFTISPSLAGAFTFGGGGAAGAALATRVGYNYAAAPTAGNDVYSTFHSFAEGAVPAGNIAVIRSGGAIVATQQMNNRCYWPDGSLKCGVFMWVHPNAIAAGASNSVDIVSIPGTFNDTSVRPASSITVHDYQMQVVIAGVTYYFRINNEITRGTNLAQTRSGPACSGYKVWGDLRAGTGPNDTIQGQMWATAHFDCNLDGTFRVFIEAHCNKIVASSAIAVTSFGLFDGNAPLITNNTPFTFFTRNKIACVDGDGREYFSGPDASQVVWAHTKPVAGDSTSTYLHDAKIAWPPTWTDAYIAAFTSPKNVPYAPNSAASYQQLFGNVQVDGQGNHNWVGTITSESTMAWLTGRYDYLRWMRQVALGGWTMCLYWCSDPVSGLPPVFTKKAYAGLSADYSGVGWALAATLSMTGGSFGGATGDSSHAGLWWWWEYLASGREWALESIMEQAVGVLGCNVASSGNYQRNPIFVKGGPQYFGVYSFFPQSRAVGWELRNLSNAHWVTPDAHLMKPYLNDLVQVQYDAYVAGYNSRPDWAALHHWCGPQQASPWMENYRVTSIMMDYRRGRIPATHPAVLHVIYHQYGMMKDGSPRNAGGAYRVGNDAGPNPPTDSINSPGPAAQSWSEVYGFFDPPDMTMPLVDPTHEDGLLRDVSSVAQQTADVSLPLSHQYCGHTYPNIFLNAASCGLIACHEAGDTTSALYVYAKYCYDYLDHLIDGSPSATETLWATYDGNTSWRIRPLFPPS